MTFICISYVTWTRVRVSVSDSGAGVRFVRIFGDTANNTWNSTQVSESDTGAGYLDSAKKLRHGCPGNTGSHWPSVKSIPLVRLCGRLVGILAFFLLI